MYFPEGRGLGCALRCCIASASDLSNGQFFADGLLRVVAADAIIASLPLHPAFIWGGIGEEI